MAPKAIPRRQWGSRYDAIKHVSESPTSVVSTLADDASVSTLSSSIDALPDVNPGSVSQGVFSSTQDDSSGCCGHQDGDRRHRQTNPSAEYGTYIPRSRGLPRWNHNASVFVASLPTLHQGEVNTIIRDTLGLHGNIIHVKLIHDMKSGNVANCAFVQFEVSVATLSVFRARTDHRDLNFSVVSSFLSRLRTKRTRLFEPAIIPISMGALFAASQPRPIAPFSSLCALRRTTLPQRIPVNGSDSVVQIGAVGKSHILTNIISLAYRHSFMFLDSSRSRSTTRRATGSRKTLSTGASPRKTLFKDLES